MKLNLQNARDLPRPMHSVFHTQKDRCGLTEASCPVDGQPQGSLAWWSLSITTLPSLSPPSHGAEEGWQSVLLVTAHWGTSPPSSSCSHSCPFFRQGSRIDEMTSVTLFTPTTACWIQKLMNAGRSLLLTLSGIIGRAADPSGAFVESWKLLCWACYLVRLCGVEIPSSHLVQQPWWRTTLPILFLSIIHRLPLLK